MVLQIVGGIVIIVGVILPICEALLYGMMSTAMCILVAGKKSFHPRHWWWIIRSPWVTAFSRLFGDDRASRLIEMGEWVHEPPFRLYKNKSGEDSEGGEE